LQSGMKNPTFPDSHCRVISTGMDWYVSDSSKRILISKLPTYQFTQLPNFSSFRPIRDKDVGFMRLFAVAV